MSHLLSSRGNKLGPSKLCHSVVALGYHGGTQSEGTTTEGLPPVVDYHGVTNFGVDYYGVTNFELDYHGGTHGTRTLNDQTLQMSFDKQSIGLVFPSMSAFMYC